MGGVALAMAAYLPSSLVGAVVPSDHEEQRAHRGAAVIIAYASVVALAQLPCLATLQHLVNTPAVVIDRQLQHQPRHALASFAHRLDHTAQLDPGCRHLRQSETKAQLG